MCGYAGFVSLYSDTSAVIANAMLDAIRQRGPDAQHICYWDRQGQQKTHSGNIGLIHSRLAIRDLSAAAEQPMSNAAGDVWICYNGEVYDWEQDSLYLQAEGFIAKTSSDTEYILNAYQAYGFEGMLAKLRGMFSFAILDLRKQKLFLARDRFGLKPLIYHYDQVAGMFAFGSTVRSVLPFLPVSKRNFLPESLDAYLAHRYIPAPKTLFKNIYRLENATCLTLDLVNFSLSSQCYWKPTAVTGDWKEELDKAIAIRTVSDRPVGVFLSGGVDSSTIAARLKAQHFDNLTCYSASFPGSSFDESEQARQFANQLDLPFRSIEIPLKISSDFERLVRDMDEPFADPSFIPTWYLARETVKEVTVVLGGDGGDEIFAGYKRYRKHLRSAWRGIKLPAAKKILAACETKGWRRFVEEISLSWEDAYTLRFSGMDVLQRTFLQPDMIINNQYWRLPDKTGRDLKHLLELDRLNYLPEYILRKADLCSMSHGLELRVPLLDHHFYQNLLSISDSERFTTPAKILLSRAAPEINPIFLRKKRGFNPPLKAWLHQDLFERYSGLGERLENLTGGQICGENCNEFIATYLKGEESLAEQVLQLLILDESLAQLDSLRQVNYG